MLNDEEINYIIDIAKQAGKIAQDNFYDNNYEINLKSDNSKVTSVDLKISKFIREKLEKKFGDIAIICEEGDVRDHSKNEFFLIDPIDGTASFADGSEEFCVNIALIKDRKPVFGLIYAPVFEGGKLLYSNSKNEVILQSNLGQKKLEKVKQDNLVIITSKRTKEELVTDFITQQYSLLKVSSAVKFFYLLEARANIYLHLRPSMEWDIAAGHYFVELIGGEVKKLNEINNKFVEDGEFLYNKVNYKNGPFIMKLGI